MTLSLALAVTACSSAGSPSAAPSDRASTRAAAYPTPARPTPPRPKPLRSVFQGAVIGIDPGHNRLNATAPRTLRRISNGRPGGTEQCNTTGTETDGGYFESTFTWRVATYLARDLRAQGARPVLTRHNDDGVGPCVNQRARIIDRAHAEVAIDIHADGGPASGRGFAILEPVPSGTNHAVVPASRRYARILRQEFLKTGMPVSTYDGTDGLQPRPDLGGLNLTTVPQVLIECGNMRNATDARLLTSPRFQRKAARAIMRAMARYLRTTRSDDRHRPVGGQPKAGQSSR